MKFRIETDTLKGLLIHISIALGLLCILSFAFFYYILPSLTNKDEVVTVPDLKGMTVDEAMEFVKGRNLGIAVADSSYDAELDPLTVLEQYPKPHAKVKVDRKINLTLNARTPPIVYYPDLTGSTFDFARKQLKNVDLKIGTIQYRVDIAHNAILESRINGQLVRAGDKIFKGSTVDLVIGNLKDRFTLPDMKDMPLDEAEAFILGINLKVKAIHYVSDGQGETDIIQKQLPQAGDTVRLGDEIELWVLKRE